MDLELEKVAEAILKMDPNGERTGRAIRRTFDWIYHSPKGKRSRWEQLHRTEQMYLGNLLSIYLQREFLLEDGLVLDFRISGEEVAFVYSRLEHQWIIPPETQESINMLLWAKEEPTLHWKLGLFRPKPELLKAPGGPTFQNELNDSGLCSIRWLFSQRLP